MKAIFLSYQSRYVFSYENLWLSFRGITYRILLTLWNRNISQDIVIHSQVFQNETTLMR